MKTNIYSYAIEQVVNHGKRYMIDFKERKLMIGRRNVELSPDNTGIKKYDDLNEWLDELENLYDEYKYSRPCQDAKKSKKFRALEVEELVKECGHDVLSCAVLRVTALLKLELFILLSLVNGSLNPKQLFAKDWFYQGADKSLVIRKSWFM